MLFFVAIFFFQFYRLPLASAICPWVSKDVISRRLIPKHGTAAILVYPTWALLSCKRFLLQGYWSREWKHSIPYFPITIMLYILGVLYIKTIHVIYVWNCIMLQWTGCPLFNANNPLKWTVRMMGFVKTANKSKGLTVTHCVCMNQPKWKPVNITVKP